MDGHWMPFFQQQAANYSIFEVARLINNEMSEAERFKLVCPILPFEYPFSATHPTVPLQS
jgi:hypothetical protein